MAADGRRVILDRVRAALGDREPPPAPDAGPLPPAPAEDLVDLLVDRLVDYRARVSVVGPEAAGVAVAALLAEAGAERAVVPPGLPAQWHPAGVAVVEDAPGIGARDLDAIGHVVTGCALAVADTGSLVFDHGAGQGRRALTLVPDHHVCLVREDQIVGSLTDAFRALADAGTAGRPVTFVSGPSATSDIELRRVEGVHGPRRLDVVIVADRAEREGPGPG
ncbi:MAG TPA: LUD domain-containing protein [Miltoncostaeaceae bacterium]|nr:LUD domain-containing protein [Miltoncostaeaceae bacterium]